MAIIIPSIELTFFKEILVSNKPIYVTQPNLPPLAELVPYLQKIWGSKVLTNGGQFHAELEEALCSYLKVPYISLFANATIALMTSIRALNLSGEVITTPYSFVATAHSILWNGLKPVFVDIDPLTLNLDPGRIESAITSSTTAILAVHVYGYPCDTDAIEAIAKKHKLKVIYDAAHAFGVRYKGGGLLSSGDLSILSFHATKVFNTFEGGAIVCKDAKTKQHIDQLKNFGFTSETTVSQAGINGKLNEFSSALGLLQLRYIDKEIERRMLVDSIYRNQLESIVGIRCHINPQEYAGNYSYFPIFVENQYHLSRDNLYEKLKNNGINSRRYFYPLITDHSVYGGAYEVSKDDFPIAKKVSNQVICLPIYGDLKQDEALRIASLIAE
jgi:dTDP-4-amino-4,6-dideoxygalactose transaminase